MKILKTLLVMLILAPVFANFKTINATDILYIQPPCQFVSGYDNGDRYHFNNGTSDYGAAVDLTSPANCQNTKIYASLTGTINFYRQTSYYDCPVAKVGSDPYYGFGYYAILTVGDVQIYYGHLVDGSQKVTNGATVSAGTEIATMGTTGCSDGQHLHFEIRRNNTKLTYSEWEFSSPILATNRNRKAGDFDGNGMKDLIIVEPSNEVDVSLSNGTSFSSSNLWLSIGGLSKDYQWDIADFNGDGKDDLIYVNKDNNYYVSLSNGSSFAAPYSFLQDHPNSTKDYEWTIANLNGDAKKDLVVVSSDNDYYVSISTGTSFNTLRWINHAGLLKDHDWAMADFNNDNKDDLLVITASNEFKVSTSDGSLFTPAATWTDLAGKLVDNKWKIADVNGDGRKDVIMATKDNDYNVCRSISTAFKCGLWQNHPGLLKDYQWNIGDFNGDKKDDLIVGDVNNAFYVSISSGTAFTTSTWIDLGGTLPESQWKIADVNGDGKSDFVLADKNSRYIVNRSTGTLFKSGLWQDHLGLNVDNAWNITDFNNDKKDDLVHVDANNDFYISLSQGTSYTTSLWAAYSGLLKDHQWR